MKLFRLLRTGIQRPCFFKHLLVVGICRRIAFNGSSATPFLAELETDYSHPEAKFTARILEIAVINL